MSTEADIIPFAPQWYPEIDLTRDPTGTVKAAADAAAAIVAEMRADACPRWLTITGLPGTGKTMLARQIIEQAKQINPARSGVWYGPARRPGCVWLNDTDFADAIMTDARLPEYLGGDYLVVLDDLGSARERFDRVADALFRLCNARLGKWTVITSNLNQVEIGSRVDQRVASRLIRDGNKGVRIKAKDYGLRDE